MYKCFAFFAVLFIMTSCQEQEYEILSNSEKLTSMLADLHIADIAINKFEVDDRDSIRAVYKTQISELYGLSVDGLDSVVWLLQSDPVRNNKAYSVLLDTLMSLEARIKTEIDEKPSKAVEN